MSFVQIDLPGRNRIDAWRDFDESYWQRQEQWNLLSGIIYKYSLEEKQDPSSVSSSFNHNTLEFIQKRPTLENLKLFLQSIKDADSFEKLSKLYDRAIGATQNQTSTLASFMSKTIEDIETMERSNPEGMIGLASENKVEMLYQLNNMAKDLWLISFAANITHGTEELIDDSLQLKSFGYLPEEIMNPKNWLLRWNLKDRVWVVQTTSASGEKRNYVLRERKTPQHIDRSSDDEVDSYSQDLDREAARALESNPIHTADYDLEAEKPLAVIKKLFPDTPNTLSSDDVTSSDLPNNNIQFAIYEYLPDVSPEIYSDQYNNCIKNISETTGNESPEYESYKIFLEKLGVSDTMSYRDYRALRVMYSRAILDVLIRINMLNKGMVNSDKDGYSIHLDDKGKLQITLFDFERASKIIEKDDGLSTDNATLNRVAPRYVELIASLASEFAEVVKTAASAAENFEQNELNKAREKIKFLRAFPPSLFGPKQMIASSILEERFSAIHQETAGKMENTEINDKIQELGELLMKSVDAEDTGLTELDGDFAAKLAELKKRHKESTEGLGEQSDDDITPIINIFAEMDPTVFRNMVEEKITNLLDSVVVNPIDARLYHILNEVINMMYIPDLNSKDPSKEKTKRIFDEFITLRDMLRDLKSDIITNTFVQKTVVRFGIVSWTHEYQRSHPAKEIAAALVHIIAYYEYGEDFFR